ncbi:MAG TPA: PEP-CTERM sorting domain-containing protein [Nitrosomonas sp.]|nr:PEP-CTERM sorting domain-containing protein [Nitrosomonas sp.]HMW21015.1 PEP-CTERM sorting domain-containing protein [Nitrosomonas sp.]HMY60381.1 PEP-CTERM sorting domain-containing protein [Nitrosomonas sp.]HNA70489.1 PEP-CTERM sorting domain-containing protein [Nitrosomonas sp.]HNB00777.1 PEP-CTERM sorting domain-containing protein [Nitrosomonas sp.]
MKTSTFKSMRLISYTLAGLFVSTSAQALFINATVTGGTPILGGTTDLLKSNRTVSDNNISTSVSASKTQATNATISQFDASQGVLVGVTTTLTAGNNTTYLRADGANAARGSASVDTSWTGSGGLNTSGNLNSVSKSGNTDGADNSWNALSQTISNGANLNSWIGAGNLISTINTTINSNRIDGGSNIALIADISSSGANINGATAPSIIDLSAAYSVTYNYMEHAVASFDGSSTLTSLDIDFGTIVLGDLVNSISFDIFNLAGVNGVALDLTSISPSGDTATFVTDLGFFSDLIHGAHNSYSASFDPTSAGTFDATYLLTLSDDDATGASASRHTYSLELHLTGTAVNPTAIPEPSMIALLGAGLLSLFGFSRRSSLK